MSTEGDSGGPGATMDNPRTKIKRNSPSERTAFVILFSFMTAVLIFNLWSSQFFFASISYFFMVMATCYYFFSRDVPVASWASNYQFNSWLTRPLPSSSLVRNLLWFVIACSFSLPGLFVVDQAGLLRCQLSHPDRFHWITEWSSLPELNDDQGSDLFKQWKEVSAKIEDAEDDGTCDDSESRSWISLPFDSEEGYNTYYRFQPDGSMAFSKVLSSEHFLPSCSRVRGERNWFGSHMLEKSGDSMACLADDFNEKSDTDEKVESLPLTIAPGTVCGDVILHDNLFWFRSYRDESNGFQVSSFDPYTMSITSRSLLQLYSDHTCIDADTQTFWAKIGLCFAALPIVLGATVLGISRRIPSMSAGIYAGLLLASYFMQLADRPAHGLYAVNLTIVWACFSFIVYVARLDRPDKAIWSCAFEFPCVLLTAFWTYLWLSEMISDAESGGDVVMFYVVTAFIFLPYSLLPGAILGSNLLLGIGLLAVATSTVYSGYYVIALGGSPGWIVLIVSIVVVCFSITYFTFQRRMGCRASLHRLAYGLACLARTVAQGLVDFIGPENSEENASPLTNSNCESDGAGDKADTVTDSEFSGDNLPAGVNCPSV